MPDHRRNRGRQPNVVALVLLGVIALALVAVVIGLAGGGDDDDETAEPVEAGAVDVVGTALPLLQDPADDPARGTVAPVLAGETFGGQSLTIPGDGPAVVVFLAHWCPHCRREVPEIVSWLEENGAPEGVALFGVATGIDPARENYPPSEWLARERWDVPTLVDTTGGAASQAYGLSAFPYFVGLNADGEVVARVTGELTADDLDALVDAARSG